MPATPALEDRLDAVEQRLPDGLARATFRLQRSLGRRACAVAAGAGRTLWNSMTGVVAAQRRAYNTVAGTAAMAAQTTATAASTVIGQTAAQSKRFGDATVDEAATLAEEARDAVAAAAETATEVIDAAEAVVDPHATATGETYEELTVDELYRRAKVLDIDGRSQMTKQQLIDAIDAAS